MKTKKQSHGCLRRNAFTLIEMLIVIAIIGVLAALIIVSVSGTRGKANATRAKADMAQIRNAVERAYSVDGCSSFNFTNAGTGNKTTLTCGGTDYLDIQLPPTGTYTLSFVGSTANCSNVGTTAWAKTACPVSGLTSYSLSATNDGGTFGYTCSKNGCGCTTSSCDTD